MINKKTVLVSEVLHYGERSADGHIFSKEAMEKSIVKFQERIKDGTVIGHLNYAHATNCDIDLQDISHKVTNLKVDDKSLQVELELLDTPSGHIAKEIVRERLPLYATASGFGSFSIVQ